jgi:hypothetical protein
MSKRKFLRFITTMTMTTLLLFGYGVVRAADLPQGLVGSDRIDIKNTSERPRPQKHGAFRIRCFYSHANNDDALVFPNQVGASHTHVYFGNTKANANSTYQSLTTSGNSTCSGGIANRSAYWMPAVKDAGGNVVPPSNFLAYYKSFSTKSVKNIPNGLKMIAGNSKSQSPQPEQMVYWECETPSHRALSHGSSIPSCAKGNNLKVRLNLPSCWDGFNLDSPDHKQHMAYSKNNQCPVSHPVDLPHVSFNVFWNSLPSSTEKWRLSSDMYSSTMPGGYSFHVDYMEAWRPEIRTTWFKNCVLGNKDCSVGLLGNGTQLDLRVRPSRSSSLRSQMTQDEMSQEEMSQDEMPQEEMPQDEMSQGEI